MVNQVANVYGAASNKIVDRDNFMMIGQETIAQV
jgi:hypothetical protein